MGAAEIVLMTTAFGDRPIGVVGRSSACVLRPSPRQNLTGPITAPRSSTWTLTAAAVVLWVISLSIRLSQQLRGIDGGGLVLGGDVAGPKHESHQPAVFSMSSAPGSRLGHHLSGY